MKTVKNAILVLGISAIAGVSAPALAADAPAAGSNFGVVDMDKVMQGTDAAKDIFSQMETKRKEYQAQISKESEPFAAAEQDLIKQKDTLSKAAFEEKYKALQQKESHEQKLIDERKRILDLAFNNALNKLRKEAAQIVGAKAKEKHYSAVFLQSAVMLSTPDLDLTDSVVAELNKNVKKIPVDWAGATAAADEAAKGDKK